ncbi:MAG TPA: GNAT family N-acetyltransferase, partial [Dokdonella sp.]|nr:GNAT family N-acetyltransferase [Dokdonella sp.]
MPNEKKGTLAVRNARLADIDDLVALTAKVYGPELGHSADMLRGQQAQFPAGQFVAEYDGRIVGFCATFRIDEEPAMAEHSWSEITGGGYASRHDPEGDWLYGMDVCVDPEFRGLRIGRRLYTARKKLCQKLGLRGIVFGGRLPGLEKRIKAMGSVEAYVQAVREGRYRDATMSFQLRNGFQLIGILPRYVPGDRESMGYAAHLAWRNPDRHDQPDSPTPKDSKGLPDRVRVATIQYQQRRIASFEQFAGQIEYFVDVAAGYESDFVVFPELITLQLLSIENSPLP